MKEETIYWKLRFQTDTALHVLNKSHDDVFENSDEEKHGLGGKDFKEEVVKVIKKKKQLRKKNVSTKSRGNKKKIKRKKKKNVKSSKPDKMHVTEESEEGEEEEEEEDIYTANSDDKEDHPNSQRSINPPMTAGELALATPIGVKRNKHYTPTRRIMIITMIKIKISMNLEMNTYNF